ncbi:MAG: hypothetical protein AAB649_02590 [Patescibacteria group bacterium]
MSIIRRKSGLRKKAHIAPRGIKRPVQRKYPLKPIPTTKPRKRRKKTPLTLAKEKLEETQKALVIKIYGKDCYTCPQKNLEGMNCQLGHVPWPRSELSVRCIFTLAFTRIQCFRCNINCGGNGAKAFVRMIKEGIDVDAMEAQNLATKGKTTPLKWFYEKRQEYQEKLLELQAGK